MEVLILLRLVEGAMFPVLVQTPVGGHIKIRVPWDVRPAKRTPSLPCILLPLADLFADLRKTMSEPNETFRNDYLPADFEVNGIELTFELGEEETLVHTSIDFARIRSQW